jgi:hypothetical protein
MAVVEANGKANPLQASGSVDAFFVVFSFLSVVAIEPKVAKYRKIMRV